VKRRIRKIGAFPSSDSFMCPVGSLLMNIYEEWIMGNSCLKLESEYVGHELGLGRIYRKLGTLSG